MVFALAKRMCVNFTANVSERTLPNCFACLHSLDLP